MEEPIRALPNCPYCKGKGHYMTHDGCKPCMCPGVVVDWDMISLEVEARLALEELIDDENPFEQRGRQAWRTYRIGTLFGYKMAPPDESYKNPFYLKKTKDGMVLYEKGRHDKQIEFDEELFGGR